VLTALLAFAAALLAAWIAYLQWKTAHLKVAIDLFDRRYQIYLDVREIAERTVAMASSTPQDLIAMNRAISSAQFLFGDDVTKYLEDLRSAMIRSEAAREAMLRSPQHSQHQKLVADHWSNLEIVSKFNDVFPPLCRRYLHLDQAAIVDPLTRLQRWTKGKHD
jgi:hypothetical protein